MSSPSRKSFGRDPLTLNDSRKSSERLDRSLSSNTAPTKSMVDPSAIARAEQVANKEGRSPNRSLASAAKAKRLQGIANNIESNPLKQAYGRIKGNGRKV